MIDWQFLIDLQDGNGQRDISDLVKYDTLTRTRRLYNELKSTTWTVSFDLTYNSVLFPLLIAQKDEILLEINRDSTAWFTGFIRPTFKIDSRNIGASGVGDVVSIEAVDNGYKLDRVHGWNGQDNLDINAGWVSNNANQGQSAVHLILAQAGYTSGEISALNTITGGVQFTIPTQASQGPNAAAGGKTYREYLSQMLFEFGWAFYFTADGVFTLYFWKQDGSVATTDTIGQNEITTYSLSRDDWRPDRVDVVYTARKTGRATVDATRKQVTTSPWNASGTFFGVVDYTRIQASGWRLTRHSAVIEVQPGPVGSPRGPLFQRVINTDDVFPVVALAAKGLTYSGVTITGFTVDGKGNYSINWTSTGRAFGGTALTLREVQAVFSYPESEGVSSRDVGSEVRPVRVDTDHLETALEAEDLAIFYAQYLTATQTKIRATCKIPESTGLPEYSLGQYLSLTEPINGISASKVRVVEIIENGFLLTDGSATTYTMNLEPVETISVNTPAAVTNPPPRFNRQPEPEPERGQSSSIIIIPPQDGSSWTDFPVQYIEWDPENDTLSVFGDLFLSGNSTVQGTITVGQDLRSSNYVAATSGWIIDGDGDAEFNNVTVRGTIVSSEGAIGGFTLSSSALTAGTGATRIGLDTVNGLYLGDDTPGFAPFRVTLAGALRSTSGTIGGFTIGSDRLSSGEAGVARLVMSQADRRFEVVDSSDVVRVAMGYLNGLPKNDGSGNFGTSDYGFWARSGDELRIDGDAEYTSGDWLIAADASYLIVDGVTPSIVRARLGTISGEQGLHINEANTGANYRARLTASRFFVGNDSTYIDFDAVGGTLTIALASFFVSSLATNVKGELNIGQAGTVTSLTNPIQLSTDGGATLGYINHATSLRLRTAGVDRVTISSTGLVGIGRAPTNDLLEIQGTASFIVIGSSRTVSAVGIGTPGGDPGIVFYGNTNGYRGNISINASGDFLIANHAATGAPPTRLTITSAGLVGINAAPTSGYQLRVDGGVLGHLGVTGLSNAGLVAHFLARSVEAFGAGVGYRIQAGGLIDGSSATAFGSIGFEKENATSGNTAGQLVLYTRPAGAGSLTARLTITSTGAVQIAQTLAVGGTTLAAGFEAQVNGDLNVTGGINSTTSGRVYAPTLTVGTDTLASGGWTAQINGALRVTNTLSRGVFEYQYTSNVSQNLLFDDISPLVPNVGEISRVVGSFTEFSDDGSGNRSVVVHHLKYVERLTSTSVRVYYFSHAFLISSGGILSSSSNNQIVTCNDGNSSTAFTASSTYKGYILV